MASRRALLSILLALVVVGGACTPEEPSAIPGIRLGMTPRDVRERFEGGRTGTWQSKVGAGDDTALEWAAKAGEPLDAVRFEFHMGMLVAIRAHFGEGSSAVPASRGVSTTPKTVTVRSAAPDGGTQVTVLARDCPTHRDEAEALVKQAGGRGSSR